MALVEWYQKPCKTCFAWFLMLFYKRHGPKTSRKIILESKLSKNMISPHWKVYKAYLNRIPTPEIDSYGVKKLARFVIIDFLESEHGLNTAEGLDGLRDRKSWGFSDIFGIFEFVTVSAEL